LSLTHRATWLHLLLLLDYTQDVYVLVLLRIILRLRDFFTSRVALSTNPQAFFSAATGKRADCSTGFHKKEMTQCRLLHEEEGGAAARAMCVVVYICRRGSRRAAT